MPPLHRLEGVEAALLGRVVRGERPRGFALERTVHALVSPDLLLFYGTLLRRVYEASGLVTGADYWHDKG